MKCLFRQLAFERGVSLFYKMKKYNQDSSVRNRFQGVRQSKPSAKSEAFMEGGP